MAILAAHPDGPGWRDAGACGAGATGVVGLAQREEDVGAGRGAMALGNADAPTPAVVPTGRLSPRRATTHVLPLCIQSRGTLVKGAQAMVGPVSVILNALAGVPATATDDLGQRLQDLFQQQGIAPCIALARSGSESKSWRSGRCRHAFRRWSRGAAMAPSTPSPRPWWGPRWPWGSCRSARSIILPKTSASRSIWPARCTRYVRGVPGAWMWGRSTATSSSTIRVWACIRAWCGTARSSKSG